MGVRNVRSILGALGNGLVACALLHPSGRATAGPQLPVPCQPVSCGTNIGFLSSGQATHSQSGNTLSIFQSTNTATLNWSSFNIGAGGRVAFDQPSSTSIALNRIFDANPSSIFGALTANGQIYLINANGFLFGSTATVNVGGLLASSLNLSSSTFASGILQPGTQGLPALQAFTDASGNPISGNITVETGATLTAADDGRLLLAAPNVYNSGSLTAPDGQIILAAGQNLYLQASDASNLRGLIVQVDGGGTVANQLQGSLSAPRGNITLTGLMVNQDGRVSATTSVAENGSVILEAADNVNKTAYTNGTPFEPTQGGTVELGPGSVTEILPEYSDSTTAVAAQTQLQSFINITGQQVFMHDAAIDAPSGALNVAAEVNPSLGIQAGSNPNAEIRIDAGTTIDLAGSDAELPMDANLLTVQLRSNEFADDPTQRGGALQSTANNVVTVTVDIRADGGLGTPIADLQSAIAAIGQTIAQRTETGGSATFESEGDVVFNPDASINVSGGHTTYEAGTIQTTKLIGANGQLYDIGSANPLLTYTGVVNPTFTQTYSEWGIQQVIPTPGLSQYESSYVQGASAGTVQFAAPSMVLTGTLQGSAVTGLYQRSSPPAGGTLIIGLPVATAVSTDYLAPSVSFATTPIPIVVADGTPLPEQTLQLPASYLSSDGFTGTTIYSNTSITLPAGVPLQLPNGGSMSSVASGTPALVQGASLTLVAPRIDVDSSIDATDGHLLFESVLSSATPEADTPRAGVGIGNGVTLDVSGQWTNDAIFADGVGTAPILQDGGSISARLTVPGSELVLGDHVTLLANGGAWLESGGTVSDGSGGAITLDASPAYSAIQFGTSTVVQGFGTGTAAGGSFTLLAPRIEISQGDSDAWTEAQRVDDLDSTSGEVLQIYAPLFSDYGFSSVSLTATGAVESTSTNDVLTVTSGTTLDVQARTVMPNGEYSTMPTGTPLASFSEVTLLPLYERPNASLSLNVIREPDDELLGDTNFGLLDVQQGASIVTDPGASIALEGEGGISIAGTLRAPGGTISAFIPSAGDIDASSAQVIDPGYVPTLSLYLAPTAVLDVDGTTTLTPNSQGLLTGTILPGGAVNLKADRGTVVTAPGSTIDMTGTAASLDVANPVDIGGDTLEVVASAGGSLTVSSAESISLLGNLNGAAGVGTSGAAAAGSLEIDLIRTGVVLNPQAPSLPSGTLQIELADSTSGGAPSPADSDLAVLGAQQIAASGIDSLTLRAQGDILIDAGQLTLGRQLILDAPSFIVTANASLAAPFVEIGNSVVNDGTNLVAIPTPSSGSGVLNVSAQQMVLVGNFSLQGTASATLSSAGDLQLQGTTNSNTMGPTTGSLLTDGNLTLNAERVYPDTYTDFAITSLAGNGATVTIGSTGTSPGSPLSADGSLSISADNIAIKGTVLAPFGTIDLAANDSLTLERGSLLSVSGAGLDVPFGETELNQGEWIYITPGGGNNGINTITAVPTKEISLSAPNVTVQSGATANVQGGGDLYAYEWVPGTGGTYDNLGATCCATTSEVNVSSVPNLYAILPAARNQAGPYDPEESGSAVPGQTIYLSGGAGIAAGFYTLLPARYALEPGAVLIQLEPSYTSASGGQIGALADGVPVVGGYLSTGTTGLHTGNGLTEYEGVAIYPSGYAQRLASYTISDASSYFESAAASAGTGPVPEPADAGAFNLTVTAAAIDSLDLQGNVLTTAASGGRGAEVNIDAPDLTITAGNAVASPGTFDVSGALLQSWNAGSITLGGTATTSTQTASSGAVTTTTSIAVGAASVIVESGVELTADQIELVAEQSINVQAGASLMSTSGKSGTPLASLPALADVELTDTTAAANPLPQAALLAVSDLSLPVVTRAATNGAPGATITVAPGATVASGGALAFDAPGEVTLAGTLKGKGASWSLSSGSVAFVGSGTSTDTLNINSALLAELQQAGALRIASQGDIDIDSPVSLGVSGAGTPALNSLTLIANSIDNQGESGATFGAANLLLEGNVVPTNTSSAPPAASPGSGTLSFVGNTLTVGPGVLSVNGFSQTSAKVQGAVETGCVDGVCAGYLNVGGNLTLDAAELTPAPDAADEPGTTLAATGTLTIGAPSAASAANALPTLVGGSLTLQANDIEDAGAIVAPSGIVALDATDSLHLLSTASIDASGGALQAVTQTAYTPGGLVTLTAGGNITLDAGSSIGVAGRGGAPAGSLLVEGGSGTVTLSGTLNGAGNGGTGGSLTVDAGTLTGGLMSLVANPGLAGFSEALNIRARNGDLDLASTAGITANSITLTADAGTVDIAGTLSAPSGAQRGLIDLSGGDSVVLESTGQLLANGSGSAGRGGEIDINSVLSACTSTSCTSTGSITLDAGSVISTYGAAQMGELVLRAPALLATNDVAINSGEQGIGANVAQVGAVIVEPVIVSPTSSATVSSDLPNAVNVATTFLGTAASGIAARLSSPSSVPMVEAGIELQDPDPTDTLAVGSYDFSQNSTQGQVVDLTVRAAGSITLSGTISDGFYAAQSGSPTTLTGMPSGSLSFVAGADLTSANPLSVLTGSAASLTLDSQTIIRTGTGDIDLAAAGNVVFQSGATVYTGGLNGTAALPVGVGRNAQLANFPTQGGNVLIAAGGSVVGAPLASNLDNEDLAVTGWQPRELTTVNGTQTVGVYGVDFDAFDWNVGALGGGDLSVTAGGTVSNLSAATADSSPDGSATLYGAGGGLRIDSVGDIGSAQVYVADGVGTLTTNAGLTPIVALPPAAGSTTPTYAGSTFALGDAQISVWARQSIQVDAVYNPTFVPSSRGRLSGQFFTYGTDSGLSLSSSDGNVVFNMEGSGPSVAALLGQALNTGIAALLDLPPNLSIQAAQQDIDLNGRAILFPSSTGELSLFAGQDIVANGSQLLMSDSFAANVPTASNPEVTPATGGLSLGGLAELQGAIHAGDSTPVLVTAGQDIDGLSLLVPKAGEVSAGRDIVNLTYQGQNVSPDETTEITAGQDITYTEAINGIEVGGQGSLDIFAGRNVNLGVSGGILTTGNLDNANLPSAEGADLTLAVGYGSEGADYASFVQEIIAPSKTYPKQLIAYVESLTGQGGLTFAEAEAAFFKLTQSEQATLVDQIFFNELLLSGRAANSNTGVGFKEGYAAINALYPDSGDYDGSLSLVSSQIYTLSGGNISILVPGGSIDVGLAYTPVGVAQKPAAELGIVAEETGNVDIYAQGDVNVNASRIFTLGGGNILIWSNEGSIDAGNGSKSSLSVPPPVVLVNADGSITLDYGASLAAGSGIRTIQTSPSTPAGDVDLDAPVGTVNAGDAGIGAAGNINIAAAHVIGALNINFGGTATGVPSDLSGLSASLSGVSSVAASATTSSTGSIAESAAAAKETAPIAQTALSWLDVFVTGLGEENCKQDDIECLKRQRATAP